MNLRAKRLLFVTGATAIAAIVYASTDGFDEQLPGTPPRGWICGVTGSRQPQWIIEAQTDAPSRVNVLKQSGQGTFPLVRQRRHGERRWCGRSQIQTRRGP
jgi:hypothetical protein